MNRKSLPVCLTALLLVAVRLISAQEQSWAGEYVDKKFLDGKAVFEMSIEQSGNAIQVSFDAAYSNGHGAEPEGQGPAKIRGKDTLEFTFKDSFNDSGTGHSRGGRHYRVDENYASGGSTLPGILREEYAPKADREEVSQTSCLWGTRHPCLRASGDPAGETPAGPTAKMGCAPLCYTIGRNLPTASCSRPVI